MLYNCGISANRDTIQTAANRLLFYSTGDASKTVSTRWTKAWIKRQSEHLKPLKSKPMSVSRLAAHIVEEVEDHFKSFKKCKEYWGIQDEDIYNFDETGFQIGGTSGENVLVPKDTTVVYSADDENKELIPSIETVIYGGRKRHQMILFEVSDRLRRYFK